MKHFVLAALALLLGVQAAVAGTPPLTVADNGRSLLAGDETFFWLGDTGWLMLSRLDRAQTERYLETRKAQGFNVIQAMILHSPQMATVAGVPALVDGDPARPNVTPGSDPRRTQEYDFWDHLDWVVERSQTLGMYMALVPAWGSLASEGQINTDNAGIYGRFLAERYRDQANIIWLNGGDVFAMDETETWSMLGRTIKRYDPGHLMTYHPRGRSDSSWTFHNAPWLDFNMYQSGHRSYDLDPDARGEDNWSYAEEDWARVPAKPTIDGEPSYENIPDGLHRSDVPRWQDADVRRYAWWAVLSGAFGHTYGENSVMQMYVPDKHNPAFHAELHWEQGLMAAGGGQMQHLKHLMLSRAFAQRSLAADLIVDNGQRYERIPALKGPNYFIAYTYTGREFTVRLGVISGDRVSANWYSPRNGSVIPVGEVANRGEVRFDPPGEAGPGNDWVLLLDDANSDARTCFLPAEACATQRPDTVRPDGRWVALFDGKTLDGWTPKVAGFPAGVNYADTFRVEDGALTGSYENYRGFDGRFAHIFYNTPYSRYRLRFEYRIHGEPAADIPVWAFRNSGVMIHSVCPGAIAENSDFPASLEFQLLAAKDDGVSRPTGNLCTPGTNVKYAGEFTERHCILSSSPTIKTDTWVKGEMLVLGDEKIVHYINDEKVLEYSQPTYGGPGSPDFNTLPVQAGAAAAGGFIAFQAEGQPVQFRNIEIMNLASTVENAESYCGSSEARSELTR